MSGKANVKIPNIINFDIFYRNNYDYIFGFGLGVDNIFGKLKISYQFEKNIYSAFKDGYSNSGSAFLLQWSCFPNRKSKSISLFHTPPV